MVGRRAKDLMMARAGCSSADTLRDSIEFIRTHPIQNSFASGVAKRGMSVVHVHAAATVHLHCDPALAAARRDARSVVHRLLVILEEKAQPEIRGESSGVEKACELRSR